MKRIMLIRLCSLVVLLLLFVQADMLAQTNKLGKTKAVQGTTLEAIPKGDVSTKKQSITTKITKQKTVKTPAPAVTKLKTDLQMLEAEKATRSVPKSKNPVIGLQLAPNPVLSGNELFAGEKVKVENLRNSNPKGFNDYLVWRSNMVKLLEGNSQIVTKLSPAEGLDILKSNLDRMIK